MHKATLFIPITLALLLTVGCGDDDSNESSARAEKISKQQYIARSNAICERTGREADEEYKRIVGSEVPHLSGDEQGSLAKAQRFLREAVIPIIRENVDARRELAVPEGDEEEIEAILAAGEKALTGFARVASDTSRVRALFEGRIPDPSKQFDSLSRSYGIDKCSGDQ